MMSPSYVLLVVIVTSLVSGGFGYWLSEIGHDNDDGDLAA